jgi:XTP/dITP diphosphohydrolase
MKLIFATQNQHKAKEIQQMLPASIEVLTLKEIGCYDDIPETAKTLEGNASLKSIFVVENYEENCFADDTGLEIEALNGEPGVLSARYAGRDKKIQRPIWTWFYQNLMENQIGTQGFEPLFLFV